MGLQEVLGPGIEARNGECEDEPDPSDGYCPPPHLERFGECGYKTRVVSFQSHPVPLRHRERMGLRYQVTNDRRQT